MSFPSVIRTALHVPSARARPQIFFIPEKAASGKRLDAVLGKVYLHSWCSLSCDMVVMRGPSEGLSLMYTHSSKKVFVKASLIGIFFTNIESCTWLVLFSGVIKCWCGTIATKLSQAAQRDSHDLCHFSSWMYLVDADDNCMLSVPLVRVTSTFAVGRVAQIAKRWLPKLLFYSTAHCGFLPKANALLFSLS